jgi:D-alanyl-D-alanine carboxypeptidase/D-alanyl-D-alanine-endopeptidase (penicillin-binding protein 4)
MRVSGTSKLIRRASSRAVVALLTITQLVTVGLAQRPAAAQPASQVESLESLRARLTAHISQKRFDPAAWGIKIVSLDSGQTIFEHNAQKYFSPASNAKLYTAALALDRLGPDFRVRTSLYATARPDAAGTLRGDLLIYGRGDPLMTARLNGGDYFKPLDPLITALMNAGVKRVDGDIIGDDSYFSGPPFGSGWEWDDLQADYGAEVSALTVEDGCLDLFVKPAERPGMPGIVTTGPPTSYITIVNKTLTSPKGSDTRVSVYRPVGENIVYLTGRVSMDGAGYYGSVAVHKPAGLFATLFKDALAIRGVPVKGRPRSVDWKHRESTPADFKRLIELGSTESAPLQDLLRETMKPSQNMYAQLLLLHVGKQEEERRKGEPATAATEQKQSAGSDEKQRGGESQLAREEGTRPASSASRLPHAGQSSVSRQAQADSQPPPAFADPHPTNEQLGLEAMSELLTRAGVKEGDVLLEEGSGLSRKDVITPNATVALLLHMSRHKWFEVYRASLPIAGVDGTLERRMKGTAAEGNLRAKTGTLRYVYTLSGFVITAGGQRLAFSIMLNNYFNSERAAALRDPSTANRPIASPRDDVDAIAIMLASFGASSDAPRR